MDAAYFMKLCSLKTGCLYSSHCHCSVFIKNDFTLSENTWSPPPLFPLCPHLEWFHAQFLLKYIYKITIFLNVDNFQRNISLLSALLNRSRSDLLQSEQSKHLKCSSFCTAQWMSVLFPRIHNCCIATIPLSKTVKTEYCSMHCLHIQEMLPESDRYWQYKHIEREFCACDLCQREGHCHIGTKKGYLCASKHSLLCQKPTIECQENLYKIGLLYEIKSCSQFAATTSQSLINITPLYLYVSVTAFTCRA